MRMTCSTLPALITAALGMLSATQAVAQVYQPYCGQKGLPVPRFASLAEDEVTTRSGPGIEHDKLWVYLDRRQPIEVVAEDEDWLRIRDSEGDVSWVHQSMVKGTRLVKIVRSTASVLEDPLRSPILINAAPGVVGSYHSCDAKHCRITVTDSVGKPFTGYVERRNIWGVHPWEPENDPCAPAPAR